MSHIWYVDIRAVTHADMWLIGQELSVLDKQVLTINLLVIKKRSMVLLGSKQTQCFNLFLFAFYSTSLCWTAKLLL